MFNFHASYSLTVSASNSFQLVVRGKYWFISTGVHPNLAEITAYYQTHGFRGLVENLSGTFAVYLKDEAAGKIYLAADQFGTLPVFFHYHPNKPYFACSTKIKSIVSNSAFQPVLNEEYLFQQSHNKKHYHTTLYQDLFRLNAGQIVTLDIKKWKIGFSLYWDLAKSRQQKSSPLGSQPSDEDYAQAYQDLLKQATFRRLVDVKQAILTLSGGFDSSVLLLMAQGQTNIEARSLCVETSILNQEIDRAVELTQTLGIPHQVLPFSLFDKPSSNTWLAALIAAQDPRLNHELLLKSQLFNVNTVEKNISQLCISGLGSDQYNGGTTAFDYSRQGLHTDWSAFLHHLKKETYIKNRLIQSNDFFEFSKPFRKNAELGEACSDTEAWAYYSNANHHFLLNKSIPIESSISLSSGYLSIYPFLDIEVVAFLQQISSEKFEALFFQKKILRKAFAKQLPASFSAKNKFHPIPHAHRFIYRFLNEIIHQNNRALFNKAFTCSKALNELFDREKLENFLLKNETAHYYPAYGHLLYIINIGLLDAHFTGQLEAEDLDQTTPRSYSGKSIANNPTILNKHIDTSKLNLSLDHIIHISDNLLISKNIKTEDYFIFVDEVFVFKTEELQVVQILQLIDGESSGKDLQKHISLPDHQLEMVLEFLWEENIISFSNP